jgi:hypothetical protein
MTASAWRVVKWTLIAYGSIVGVGAAIVIGLVFYVVNSGPDSCSSGVLDSIETENARGDAARAEIKNCFLFAAFVNTSISLQLHDANGISPKKTLIDFEFADNANDPILRWVDDNTLSVDLGRVYWVSSRFTRWGPVRIIYIYSVVDRPG